MTGILLATAYAVFFIFLIRRLSFFKIDGISQNALTAAFIVKIIFGIIFWAVYTFTYQMHGDAFYYFNDGKAIYGALFERPLDYFKILMGFRDPSLDKYLINTGYWDRTFNQGLYNDTRTIIRFNAIADIFSFGNYQVHTVFMCFLSFTGLVGLCKFFTPYFPNKKIALFVIVFFIPSVLFWGSGVLKEGLILFATGMLLYYFHKLQTQNFSSSRLIGFLSFGILLCLTKIYMLVFLIPGMVAHVWIVKTDCRMSGAKYLVVLTSMAALGVLQRKIDLPYMLMDKQRQSIYMSSGGSYLGKLNGNKFVYIEKRDFRNRIIFIPGKNGYCKIVPGTPYVSWRNEDYADSTYVSHSTDTSTYWIYYNLPTAGSRIDIPLLYPSFISIVKNSPIAFFNTAFRPHLLEARNPMMLISAVENILIAGLILVCLIFASRKIADRHILYFCASVVGMLFVLIGLTTPILGAVVRYKVPGMPFFLIIFLMILDKDKLLNKFPFLKKFIA